MSLQDEIIKEGDIIQDHKNRLAVEYDEHGLNRVINKVLDAAVEAIKQFDSYDEPVLIEAINKLRGEK